MKKGIDVSEHNGLINWGQVQPHVDFVMIRAGYGQGTIDKQFRRNIEACNRLGIPVGVYWFSYATDVAAAKREANFCLEAIKPYKVDYPVAFDFEYDSVSYARKKGVTISKVLSSEMAKAFCGAVESAGYHALNYSNRDYLANYFDATVKYDVWLAEWPASVGLTKDKPGCVMWQYSSKGNVPGISGYVDMDVCYKEYEEENDMRYNTLSEIPSWGQDAVKKLILSGKLKGKSGNKDAQGYPTDLDLSEDMIRLIVMLV